MSVKIAHREVHGIHIVDLSGRIVLGDETASLRDVIRDLLAQQKKKIILNMQHVTYVDSWAVGQLVSSWTTVRNAGGEMKLLNLTQKVIDVLHVTRLYSVFDIKDNEFTAIKSFDYNFAR